MTDKEDEDDVLLFEDMEDDDLELDEETPSPDVEEAKDSDEGGKPDKRVSDAQKKVTEQANELKALRDELMKLTGKLEASTKKEESTPPPEHPLAYLENEEEQDKLLDDPKAIVAAMNKQMGFIIDLLKTRDRAILEEINGRDPEVKKETSVVEKLRQNPRFKDFTDSELSKMVRSGVIKVKQQEEEDAEEEEYSGTPGGGRRGGGGGASGKNRRVEDEVKQWERRLGYDRFDVK